MPSAELVHAGEHRQLHDFELEEMEPLVDDQEEDNLDAEEQQAHHDHRHDVVVFRSNREVVRHNLEHDHSKYELVERIQMLNLPVLPVQVVKYHLI